MATPLASSPTAMLPDSTDLPEMCSAKQAGGRSRRQLNEGLAVGGAVAGSGIPATAREQRSNSVPSINYLIGLLDFPELMLLSGLLALAPVPPGPLPGQPAPG